jgi:hypothetical protein
MNDRMRMAVKGLLADGYEVTTKNSEVVRLTKGAAKRIVLACGTIKVAHHTHWKAKKFA